MFSHSKINSEEEINRYYSEHLDSLLLSGLPFDEEGLRQEWAEAIAQYRLSRL